MSFLTPLFLLGLAGLAVPIVIHLIQRERKNVVHFPSLMFLRRIPYQSVRRRRIRNWPLLLLRLAALALIVLAFARPFFRRASMSAAAAGGAREVVVLVDRSYSMGYGDRWARAVAGARDAVSGLGPGDRASIVFFATGAEVALRSTSDRARLDAAIAAQTPRLERDAFRAGVEARRQHPGRIRPAAPRGDPRVRFPARRLDWRRRRAAAGRRDADAGAGDRSGSGQPQCHARVAPAHDVLGAGPRDRHGRRRESREPAAPERRDRARSGRPVRAEGAARPRARRIGVGHLRAVHAGRAQHARYRPPGAGPAARRTTPSTSSCRRSSPCGS